MNVKMSFVESLNESFNERHFQTTKNAVNFQDALILNFLRIQIEYLGFVNNFDPEKPVNFHRFF